MRDDLWWFEHVACCAVLFELVRWWVEQRLWEECDQMAWQPPYTNSTFRKSDKKSSMYIESWSTLPDCASRCCCLWATAFECGTGCMQAVFIVVTVCKLHSSFVLWASCIHGLFEVPPTKPCCVWQTQAVVLCLANGGGDRAYAAAVAGSGRLCYHFLSVANLSLLRSALYCLIDS